MSKPWPRRAFKLPWQTSSEIDADLDAELAFHLDQRIADLVKKGMHPSAARDEALRKFGDMSEARRYIRAVDTGRARTEQRRDWLSGWQQDIGFAVRQLVRAPGFTIVAALTLALGVGANTAIFSVVHRLVLNPLPYANSDQMVALVATSVKNQLTTSPEWQAVNAWREKSHTITAIEAFDQSEVTLTVNGEPEALTAGRISETMPAFLGITPIMGRGFVAEEAREGGTPVVILGYGLWQRRFGGRRDVLGQSIALDGKPFTVIGVMPRDVVLPFIGSGPQRQIWLPLVPGRERMRVQAMGRLRPGTTADQASAELTTIQQALEKDEQKSGVQFTTGAVRPQDMMTGNMRNMLLILFGVVGVVLLIACANVANLLLARASTRGREFAIRTALGAGRARLIRQLLTESLCLALIGGAIGLFLASRGLDLLLAFRPDGLSELDDVRLQPIALGWSLGLSLITGLLFGLAPAFFATDRSLNDSLKASSAGAGGHRTSRRMRAGLVVAEVAMSVTLLVGAGLLIRTVNQLQQVEIGFNAAGLTDLSLRFIDDAATSAEKRSALAAQVLERVRAIPGVTGASYSSGVPPRSGAAFGKLEIEGHPVAAGEETSFLGLTGVSPEYFSLLQLPLRAGATFPLPIESHHSIISEGMAKRFWPGESAVGKRYRMNANADWQTVVAVAADVTVPGRRGDWASLSTYYPMSSSDLSEQLQLLVRTEGDIAAMLPLIQRAILAMGPQVLISRVSTVESMIDNEIAGPRFSMALFVAFAGLALVLATIGLYGVISYSVGQRTREIGVRIALGAGGTSVLRLVVGQGMRLTAIGIVVGLIGAAAGTRAIQSLLIDVNPLDPVTFGVVTVLLLAVAMLASYLPARRATRVDPVVALKSE